MVPREAEMRVSRRQVLRSCVGGWMLCPGIIAELLGAETQCASTRAGPAVERLAAREPHFGPKARRVIFLFSTGGVSHMDTFDYKPRLFRADGRMMGVGGGLSLEQRPLLRPRWEFR